MKKGSKKGQVTIFIIIAIVVVGLAVLFYSFYPQLRSTFISEIESPQAFIQSCLEEDIENTIDKLSLQGGDLDPEFFYQHGRDKLRYLCYSSEYYKLCTVQEPLLKEHIEEEIKEDISAKASECFIELKKVYQDKGYQVTLDEGSMGIELLPKRVVASFNNTLTLRKETAETYDTFRVVLNNNLYELTSIAISIIDFETTYGDAETTFYMDYYRDLKVEKLKQSEGTTVYILTDLNTDKKFQFASRSMAWKPGYSWE